MSKNLEIIRKKIDMIRHGLLRHGEGSKQITMQVSTLVDEGSGLNCFVMQGDWNRSLLNRKVRLIQKEGNDYLYITGKVDAEKKSSYKTISLKIIKACWFTKKKEGNAVWLQEKCIYEMPEKEKGNAA